MNLYLCDTPEPVLRAVEELEREGTFDLRDV